MGRNQLVTALESSGLWLADVPASGTLGWIPSLGLYLIRWGPGAAPATPDSVLYLRTEGSDGPGTRSQVIYHKVGSSYVLYDS